MKEMTDDFSFWPATLSRSRYIGIDGNVVIRPAEGKTARFDDLIASRSPWSAIGRGRFVRHAFWPRQDGRHGVRRIPARYPSRWQSFEYVRARVDVAP
jgi:hypothetical protein